MQIEEMCLSDAFLAETRLKLFAGVTQGQPLELPCAVISHDELLPVSNRLVQTKPET